MFVFKDFVFVIEHPKSNQVKVQGEGTPVEIVEDISKVLEAVTHHAHEFEKGKVDYKDDNEIA